MIDLANIRNEINIMILFFLFQQEQLVCLWAML